jgi:uncharacterized RDD family membrane protein YckC
LAATWIDSFVIYVIAALLITLAAIVRIRIALEPLFVVIGIAYGTLLLARGGQTVGKTLMGITVIARTGAALSLRQVMLREMLGKWGITVVLPVVLGRTLVGQAWVPTAYDLLVVSPVLLLLLVYGLIAKRAWYDQLAGTEVNRLPSGYGKVKLAFVVLAGAALLGLGTKAAEFTVHGRIPCRLALYRSMRSTGPYVAFLRQGQVAPVDYVIGLFDRYDVVVLCERLHPEASQWDFIYEIVRDPRFIDRVGHVFTEYGTVGMQANIDSLMAADGLGADEVDERIVHIMRNFAVWPTWDNTNFYNYLMRLYALNQPLPSAQRIRHHFTDTSVDWSGITTKEEYRAYYGSIWNRDQQMARCVIEQMGQLAKSTSRSPKCLVVMNYRHAFDLTKRSPKAQRHNTYEYLKDAFGDRAANVLLNTWFVVFYPLAGGVWDSAFAATGNRPAGFDFQGSPFGEDPFDLFPYQPAARGKLRYRDVFTGFVYVNPVESQYRELGVPGFYKGFENEALRRAELVSDDYRRAVTGMIASEKMGSVPMKDALPNRAIESRLELSLLGVSSVGLLIGLAVFALGWQRGKSQQAR